ncbi:MAG TPA: amino acid ABC transporter ATP-binding protein [Candidatus Scybalocola faecigallinarum]|uniref:Amino acid ABC transporter ATP-binding protein n=1 Tax=Candidatus Scybalocola faecigallinarum TaxID=2840941 RepID=A0A9D1JSJ5_9FIRM|nr:amino acid ABC transporter ATP-binding protein [Candidatus Scybalocola faecigallinarum]
MLLEVSGLYKAFKGNQVLSDINFSVEKGEIVSLLGQSGAGKTTIIRCVAGLERPDRGSISINGQYICREKDEKMAYAAKKELDQIRRQLGMVFQSYHLFPHMTVLKNVTLALTDVHKMSQAQAREKAMAMLKSLGLENKADSRPYELSGGQKQRVAIARSCVTNPRLLCFDEPTAALDPQTTREMTRIIKDLAGQGMGILIISHDIPFVKDVSDRVLMVEQGKIRSQQ